MGPETADPHDELPLVSTPRGVLVEVRVIPRAGRSGIAGLRAGALLVRLAAAPVDGAANVELASVLAEALGVPRRSVSLAGGERSRTKRVLIEGFAQEAVREALRLALRGGRP